jgi:flagellar biosynthesis protein FlhF
MQVKVFEAEDMGSALKKVRETLGPDALILSTRTVRRKGMGLLGKPMTEITAAIDGPASIATGANTSSDKSPARPAKTGTGQPRHDDIRYEDIWRTGTDSMIDLPVSKIQGRREHREATHLSSIREEIDTIKDLVQGFARDISDMSKAIAAIRDPGQSTNMLSFEEEWLAPVVGLLASRGIQAEATAKILKRAAEKLTPGQVKSRELLDDFFVETITDLVQVNSPLLLDSPGQKRVALVGPTGVGKTTTIAKLAAAYLKKFGLR